MPAAEFSSLVLMVDQSLTSFTLVAGNWAEAGLEAGAEAGLPRTGRMGGRCTSWLPACSYSKMVKVCCVDENYRSFSILSPWHC